ncbi:hypothetical protein ACI1MP_38235 (plasmid) [Kitasatospora griseola]|uniref:hypothetical protein n=1 Tax=Kitasatospora griseola TaxID=2064 RepID=UPI0038557F78
METSTRQATAASAVALSAGHYKALRELAAALAEVHRLERPVNGSPERTVAELLELLELDEAAYSWWAEAALLGDEDAIDYLEILEEERSTSFPVPVTTQRVEYCNLIERELLALLAGTAVPTKDRRAGHPRSTDHPRHGVLWYAGPAEAASSLHDSEPRDGHSLLSARAHAFVREIEEHFSRPETLAADRGGSSA